MINPGAGKNFITLKVLIPKLIVNTKSKPATLLGGMAG
jgi:hypothetical protein